MAFNTSQLLPTNMFDRHFSFLSTFRMMADGDEDVEWDLLDSLDENGNRVTLRLVCITSKRRSDAVRQQPLQIAW